MSIVPLLVFCSLVLVAGAIVLFVWSCKQGDCHEAERLCLLPLADDTTSAAPGAGSAPTSPSVPRNETP